MHGFCEHFFSHPWRQLGVLLSPVHLSFMQFGTHRHTFPESRLDWTCRPDWFFFSQHVPFLAPELPHDQNRHLSFARHFEQQSEGLDAFTPPLIRSAPW